MIYGVGIDLVKVARIEAALARFGERFARRILTARELEAYTGNPRPADFLAKHFAAKEALVKALGTGIRLGIQWQDMELGRDAFGKPYVTCAGRVRALFEERGIGASLVSLSDEEGFAVALVVLEQR